MYTKMKTNKNILSSLISIFVVIFFLLPSSISAMPEIVLENNTTSYTKFDMEYLEEKFEGSLGIDEIVKIPFTETVSNRFSFGYSKNNFWFHFSIFNNSENTQEFILTTSENIHKVNDLYILSNKEIYHKKNGLRIPIDEREIKESNPSFLLKFSPYEKKEIYINIQSIYGVFGAIEIYSPEKFYNDTELKNNLFAFYFGAVVILALYNLFIFFYLKEKVYFYYVSYVLVFILWVATYKGILLPYINMDIYNILQTTIPIFFVMLILFSQIILETQKHLSLLHKVLNGFIAILVISFIWMLISPASGFYFLNLTALPLMPSLLLISFLSLKKGETITKIYLLGLAVFIISMILINYLVIGILPYSNLLSNAPILGSIFEILLFSVLLAYRISLLSQEALKIQEQLLEQQRTESKRLFHTVAEKTSALNFAKKQLEEELKKKQELEDVLKHQATTDFLTGLMNRRSFLEVCDKELQHAQRYNTELSYLTIDIDKFKNINDTYGHPFGDKVIYSIAQQMLENTRSIDYVGRLGGEEFAILMPATDIDSAYQLADRLRAKIAKHEITYNKKRIIATVSIGLSSLRRGDGDIENIISRSDQALYSAKENGRNQTVIL